MTDHVGPGAQPDLVDGEPAVHVAGVVTLVEGSTFCISGRTGDVWADSPQGLFFRDTRILSHWRLRIGGEAAQVLTVVPDEPYRRMFVARVASPGSGSDLLLERVRFVGDGMREDLRLRNLGGTPVTTTVSLEVAADFADLFAVKESRFELRGEVSTSCEGDALTIGFHDGEQRRGVRVHADGAHAGRDRLEFAVTLPARGDWRTSVLVNPSIDGVEIAGTFPVGMPLEEAQPARRLRTWREGSPYVETDNGQLLRTLTQSLEDLGALRIFDPDHPESVAVAAGAPWFMALFGRDSLLSSYMALPLDQTLALGTLEALAQKQGSTVDERTEEQPGRILHETRLGLDFPLSHGGGSVYYGTADATPLFVVVLGELRRWGLAPERVDALLPHADRALDWCERYGDRDGDGFVEYQRMTSKGLRNQGWKDSWDGVNYADGRIAEPPIALCEVQGYTYAAYLTRSHFAHAAGDAEGAEHWGHKAGELKRRFNEQFWLEDRGWFAIGLDGDKRPIDALTSNIGHCLWTGIVDRDKAARVAAHLLSPEMFAGWGVRTLASSMGAYNPMSYHNGSIWPHDNAIVATGLMRYGFVEEAQRIATGVLDAAALSEGSLPELFCGFDRGEYPTPLPYPTSCSPQAWAAATPVQLMRALLGVDPWVPRHQVWFAPAWPDRYGPVTIHNLRVGASRATLSVGRDGATITGLPADVEVVRTPRGRLADIRPSGGF
ncbi:MAG TPA: glycogen debranching N-terminal domain-containing protein [Mycobacteriales bacterium]